MLLFFSAFTFIFLAALPGRTTFLMLLMSARGQSKSILTGAMLAFGIQSLISLALGDLFGFLPKWVIHLCVGLLFLYFAVHFWRDSKSHINAPQRTISWKSAFSIIFAAEWGDVSQVAIVTLSAQHTERLTILISAILALWLIAILAITLGSHIHRIVSPSLIQKIAAIGFAFVGVYLLSKALLFSL